MQIEKALTIDHLRISTIYIFNNLKAIDSLTRVTNFLLRKSYLSLLFKVKIGPSLNLSCPDFRKGRLPPHFRNVLAYHRIGKKIAG